MRVAPNESLSSSSAPPVGLGLTISRINDGSCSPRALDRAIVHVPIAPQGYDLAAITVGCRVVRHYWSKDAPSWDHGFGLTKEQRVVTEFLPTVALEQVK